MCVCVVVVVVAFVVVVNVVVSFSRRLKRSEMARSSVLRLLRVNSIRLKVYLGLMGGQFL